MQAHKKIFLASRSSELKKSANYVRKSKFRGEKSTIKTLWSSRHKKQKLKKIPFIF